jgi:hypothetical protein
VWSCARDVELRVIAWSICGNDSQNAAPVSVSRKLLTYRTAVHVGQPKVEDHGVRWSDVDQPYRFETVVSPQFG